MRAAIIQGFGQMPVYEEFPDPVPSEGEQLIDVKACVLENFDKLTVGGGHYSSKKMFPQFPAIIGTDGVGKTKEGQWVVFGDVKPPFGAFAEKASAGYCLPIPDGIDAVKASAIMPSVLTSMLPLKYSAKLRQGETILINGATGVSGRIAVQVAKMLGAAKIIGTGRNESSLQLLTKLGCDETINLSRTDEGLQKAFKRAIDGDGFDVVIDFLWGRPAEILISTLIPEEVGFARRTIRYIQVGEKAGSNIIVPASAFRTSGLQLMGMGELPNDVLAQEIDAVWKGMLKNQFYMEIEVVPLSDISQAWQRSDLQGKRLVVVP